MLRRRIFLLICSVTLSSFIIFGGNAFAQPKSGDIVVTTNILTDLVKNIVGDDIPVTGLMKAGIDPHLYKATQGDIVRLGSAKVIFYNGLELEGKLGSVLEKMNSRVPTLAVAETLSKDRLRSAEEIEKIYDPHIWFSPPLWKDLIPPIVKLLSGVFPDSAPKFRKNGEEYRAKLDKVHEWATGELQNVPKERRVLVTAHDAFGYFGIVYDFEVIGLQGVSTESEFGLADLARISKLVIDRKIPAVFVESSVPHNFVQALVDGTAARGWPLKLGGELFSDSLGPKDSGADTYLKMVRHNVKTIADALK